MAKRFVQAPQTVQIGDDQFLFARHLQTLPRQGDEAGPVCQSRQLVDAGRRKPHLCGDDAGRPQTLFKPYAAPDARCAATQPQPDRDLAAGSLGPQYVFGKGAVLRQRQRSQRRRGTLWCQGAKA